MRIELTRQSRHLTVSLENVVRDALIAVDFTTALTAMGGGIALVSGLEASRVPVEWLNGTPFHSYRIPGLILGAAVGGSAAVATIATLRRWRLAAPASVTAGLVMLGWIAGEFLLLDQPNSPTTTEVVYISDGLVLVALGLLLRRAELA